MSRAATDWAFQILGLPSSAKLLLLDLADRMNHGDGRCDPSVDLISERTGLSRDTISRMLKVLSNCGLVTVTHRANKSSLFQLHVGRAPQFEATEAAHKGTKPPSADAFDPAKSDRRESEFAAPRPRKLRPLDPAKSDRHREPGKEPGTEPGKEVLNEKVALNLPLSLSPRVRAAEPDASQPGFDLPPSANPPAAPGNVIVLRTQAVALADAFEQFWLLYPRKTAKGDARTAWLRAAKKHPPAAIVEALRERIPHFSPEPRFIPHPATWLNQERWSDEIASLQRVAASAPISAAEQSAYAMGLTPADLDAFLERNRRT